jgi:hypothetical protein
MVAMILTVVNRLKGQLDGTKTTFRKSTFGKSRAKLKSKL